MQIKGLYNCIQQTYIDKIVSIFEKKVIWVFNLDILVTLAMIHKVIGRLRELANKPN